MGVIDVAVGGYVETYYEVHVQHPENRITNLRGYDDRSRTFTFSNIALDVKGESGPVTTRIAVQTGAWGPIQVATITARLPEDFVVEAGLVPSPIGLEVVPVKDNWNYSRSNLFFGLPFFHTGATIARPLGAGFTAKLHVYNGWNSVADNNDTPSVAASIAYASASLTAQAMYFGGIEVGSWRHVFDAYAQLAITDELGVALHGNAGFERTELGTDEWAAGAVYAKLQLAKPLYVAARGDVFYETGGSIFWPVKWVAEATATLAYQPTDRASLRLELRHDQSADDVYFRGANNETTRFQDTVTLGATTWF